MKSHMYKKSHEDLRENIINEIQFWIDKFGVIYVTESYSEKEIDMKYNYCSKQISVNRGAVYFINCKVIRVLSMTTSGQVIKREEAYNLQSTDDLIKLLAYTERYFRARNKDAFDIRYPIKLEDPPKDLVRTNNGAYLDDVMYTYDELLDVYYRKDVI